MSKSACYIATARPQATLVRSCKIKCLLQEARAPRGPSAPGGVSIHRMRPQAESVDGPATLEVIRHDVELLPILVRRSHSYLSAVQRHHQVVEYGRRGYRNRRCAALVALELGR